MRGGDAGRGAGCGGAERGAGAGSAVLQPTGFPTSQGFKPVLRCLLWRDAPHPPSGDEEGERWREGCAQPALLTIPDYGVAQPHLVGIGAGVRLRVRVRGRG